MKVGVLLPPGDLHGTGKIFSYPELRTLAKTAEVSDLDSIWIYDHLVFQFGDKPKSGMWECWTIMSALAEATNRVELGALVLCTAFRNPAVLAKMAVTLDAVSDQRLILGLGAGWHEPGFSTFGIPFNRLVDRFEEALEIIVPLVREGKVDVTGEYVSAPDCDLIPGPTRQIPVLIASSGPRMLRLTAQYADSWNTAWLGDVSALTPARTSLEAACAETGRDPGSLEVTVGINVAFADLGGNSKAAEQPQKFLSGSVEQIAAGLRGYADAGVGHVIAWLDPVSDESIRRFAEAASLAQG